MATQGEAAVLILAAGAGTRMRSDTPKVLHPLAGRSMLAHSLHSIAKMAPQHLVVVLGQDHGSIERGRRRIGQHAGAFHRRGNTRSPARHRSRRAVRPVGAARRS
jgi:bifunctional N-acetylglucosamine-1-phosphate-uridyltransferase/glucosamine-1-phosphate-acetyltransferase GlmU-like protein